MEASVKAKDRASTRNKLVGIRWAAASKFWRSYSYEVVLPDGLGGAWRWWAQKNPRTLRMVSWDSLLLFSFKSYPSMERASCGRLLACINMEVAACWMIDCWLNAEDSSAKSASRIRLRASAWLAETLD